MADRYVVLKASGSRFADVQDTEMRRTVHRYDIFRTYGGVDGWDAATKHAANLNAMLSRAEGGSHG
ncbi:hypothetical protein ACQR5W_11850 [Xanthomonas sacchari]